MGTIAANILVGALVSYTAPGTSDIQCLEVRMLTFDWGQTQMAWLTVVADPRRVIHVPINELTPGCAVPPSTGANAAPSR
jgi:hypothetical protein